MELVLAQMSALILCGLAWRYYAPADAPPDVTRRALTAVVYFLFMPALMLIVLWRSPLNFDSVAIAGTGWLAALSGVLGGIVLSRALRLRREQQGAVILAVAFPNVTFLGLPVLEQAFGALGRAVAVQIDLFALTPLVWTLGIAVSAYYGDAHAGSGWRELIINPSVWAGSLGIGLNLAEIAPPPAVSEFLGSLAAATAPVMLLCLGLGLRMPTLRMHILPTLSAVALAKLAVLPLLCWLPARWLGLGGDTLTATILECAMPSMLVGMVLADRYKLDSALYAMLATVTTALSLISLPLWHRILES